MRCLDNIDINDINGVKGREYTLRSSLAGYDRFEINDGLEGHCSRDGT